MPSFSGKWSTGLDTSSDILFTLPTGYNYWVYNALPSPGRMQINISSSGGPGPTSALANVRQLRLNGTYSYTYSNNKCYQFITNTIGFKVSASFSITTPWNDTLALVPGTTGSAAIIGSTTQSYFHYSTPESTILSSSRVTFAANGTFSTGNALNPGITSFEQVEIDFSILGYSYFKMGNQTQPSLNNSLGWHYSKSLDEYIWYDYVAGTISNSTQARARGFFPVGGPNGNKVSDVGYRLNNALYKFIPFSNFNFSFFYQSTGNTPLRIYLSPTIPNLNPAAWNATVYTPPSGSVLLATITQSFVGTFSSINNKIPVEFYGVSGNRYLIIVGGSVGVSSPGGSTYSTIILNNLKIEGGYHPGNNRRYTTSNFATYSVLTQPLIGATYSATIGNGNTINATASLSNPGLSRIYSKIGNGKFNAGIWENGVWNSGWRVDENMYEFYNVSVFVSYRIGRRWRIQINGPSQSVSKFNIGDNVAISNIVAIDINEDRKLIKGYYTIINKTTDSIIVEFDNNFPLRRIEKDSEYHRIYVTKNVWLSGGFLNGYFTGIWNYGLFKGYPLITEMYNTHWIDGVFDGGHFYSERYSIPNFVDTIFSSGYVGLTFTQSHGLVAGDLITIDKTNKNINPQYDGDHLVTSVVNDYQVVTDIEWGSDSLNESGAITIDLSKGLLQKVNFKSNNISKITSITGAESSAVFLYNSWLDVVYDTDYATNIGRPQSFLNRVSKKPYSENNLYGYITKDVLESNSTFRDSFSNTVRSYRLGTKYKIFSDFIGDAGNFEEDFGATFSDGTTDRTSFLKYGWTYSGQTLTSITFSRVQPSSNSSLREQMRVQSFRNGGILDITPTSEIDITNRTYGEIQRLRYTKIEYDLVTYSNNISEINLSANSNRHEPFLYQLNFANTSYFVPPIHFDNLNIVRRDAIVGGIPTILNTPATYLPINQNVNPFLTRKQKKVEYFYNKRSLGMHFYGYGPSSNRTVEYVIDNLHFYEVDMIPFFSYFTEDNINKGVAIPFQGLSPFIDYSNSAFVFIDNISIGLDSIRTQNSNTVVSGVGIGNSSNVVSGSIYAMEVSTTTGPVSSL